MARISLFLLLVAALASISLVSAATCSAKSKCPASAPCCSEYGYCGSEAAHCLGGCDPLASFTRNSCKPMPKCKAMSVSFTDSAKPYVSLANFKGDPDQAPFTLDSGTVTPTKAGLKMLLTKDGPAADGTRLSSTRYMYYGTASAVMKHGSWAGVVNTFIGMSSTRDEIDWEFTTDNLKDVETNYYWFGQPEGYTHGFRVANKTLDALSNTAPKPFRVSDWHTYTIDWSEDRIKWLVDGTVVRTLPRSKTLKKKTGIYHYPSSPVRLQLSIWGGGDGNYGKGTEEWTGGRIRWSETTNGAFVNMIKSYTVTCNDPKEVTNSNPNYAFSATKNNALNGQPAVVTTSKSALLSS